MAEIETTSAIDIVRGKFKKADKGYFYIRFPYHYSQTDVSGIAAQLPDIDVRIRHYE